jgi:uncharacterized protein YukE
MASYTVDLNSMIQASNTLDQYKSSIQQRCQQALDATKSAQSSGWLDEASDSFNSQMSQWSSDQSQMLAAMVEFGNALAASEKNYNSVSKKNASAF